MTISIKALFLSRILSAMLIREFFILFLTLVTSYMPLRKRFSNSACLIYPLSAHNFPFMFSRNQPCFNGSRSSTFPGVSMKFWISPLSLIIRCNLPPQEPFHGTSSTLGKFFKCLMNQDPLVTTYAQGSRIDKTDAGTSSQQDFLNENGQWKKYVLLQFYETVL